MRITDMRTEIDQQAFAAKAALAFRSDPKMWSYTDAEVEPGCMLALRWGLGDDCVLVLKIDEYHEPTIYGQLIRRPFDTSQNPE